MPAPLSNPSQFVRVEADALLRLAARMDAEMRPALDHALALLGARASAGQRVAVTGIGKSGIVARKIAATFNSTGTRAFFLHPADALHGDLGALAPGDLVLALSYSGESEELLRLLPAVGQLGCTLISMTGCLQSTLAWQSAVALDTSVPEEACHLNLAPTASTAVMLALGDALALELSRRAGFQPHDFAQLHPGGRLGRRLARVRDLMHRGEALPHVSPATPMSQVIYEMSSKKLGMTTVLEPVQGQPGRFTLAGIVSDGDLRRLLERVGPHALERSAGDIMNRTPVTVAPNAFASEALLVMEERKITSLVVVEHDHVLGVVHLHDLWQQAPG